MGGPWVAARNINFNPVSYVNIPTLNALEQHVKRAAYQAGHIQGQTFSGKPKAPSPELWGWKRTKDEYQWTPYWTTLPEAAKDCQELLKCGCKKECTK